MNDDTDPRDYPRILHAHPGALTKKPRVPEGERAKVEAAYLVRQVVAYAVIRRAAGVETVESVHAHETDAERVARGMIHRDALPKTCHTNGSTTAEPM
jgi:hypothetical protein